MNNDIKFAILGAITGDVLGVPYEFKKRNSFNCVDLIEGGVWQQPLGSWSDDSSMILALIDSIIEKKQIDYNDIMYRFGLWFYQNWYTPFGTCFDSGETCTRAIEKFYNKTSYDKCGGTDIMSNGNGALMRIIPMAFLNVSDDVIKQVAGLTHNHEISHSCCLTYVNIAKGLIKDKNFDKTDKFKHLILQNINIRDITKLTRDEIKSSGYVVDTLEAALWCLYNTNNFEECVLTAVNLGKDTDTVGCVVGGLAGIKYQSIPQKWLDKIPLSYPNKLIEQFITTIEENNL